MWYIARVQPWSELRQDLVAHGYRPVSFLAFACPEGHGRFRAGVAQLTPRISCPRCGLACKPTYLAQGLTQRPLPVVEAQSAEMRPPPGGSHELKYISRVSRRAFEKSQSKAKLSGFELQVRKLRLHSEQSMASSKELRRWVVRHRHRDFVPEYLLARWGMPLYEIDVGRWVTKDSA